jgi:hypothetical protein
MKTVLIEAGFRQANGGNPIRIGKKVWKQQRLWILDPDLNDATNGVLRKQFFEERNISAQRALPVRKN